MRDLQDIDGELSFLAALHAKTRACGGHPTMLAIDLLLDERNAANADSVRSSESQLTEAQ